MVRALSSNTSFATVFEVADDFEHDRILLLVEKVAGRPISDWIGVFELYEDACNSSPHIVAESWTRSLCDSLCLLHKHKIIHGDISPENVIELEGQLKIIDYDLVQTEGEEIWATGKVEYCPAERIVSSPANCSHDMYSVASTMFHVVFGRRPFRHGSHFQREDGVNWNGIDRHLWSWLPEFITKATSPNKNDRFLDAVDAAAWIAAKDQSNESPSLEEEGRSRSEDHKDDELNLLISKSVDDELTPLGTQIDATESQIAETYVEQEAEMSVTLHSLPVQLTESSEANLTEYFASDDGVQVVSARIARVRERLLSRGKIQLQLPQIEQNAGDRPRVLDPTPALTSDVLNGEVEQSGSQHRISDSPFPASGLSFTWDTPSPSQVSPDVPQLSRPHSRCTAEYLPKKSWFALAKWAAEEGYLINAWERQFLYSLGVQRSRLSEKQLNIAEPLLELARRHGFSD